MVFARHIQFEPGDMPGSNCVFSPCKITLTTLKAATWQCRLSSYPCRITYWACPYDYSKQKIIKHHKNARAIYLYSLSTASLKTYGYRLYTLTGFFIMGQTEHVKSPTFPYQRKVDARALRRCLCRRERWYGHPAVLREPAGSWSRQTPSRNDRCSPARRRANA